MLLQTKNSSILNPTLETLLSELEEECNTVLTLLHQLRLSNLSNDQKGDILAELVGSISHLHVHTENLPDLIGDELLQLPD
ncbi:MAG: hypothetical protein KA717_35910 [Woronichinia naegeliana WA131]|jgi:hypothetical protein|uniref:Uncharacterized protein n=1 Tax=Woronichinia naegeliana WA131 TaxID=2824559 RepID=A0A977PVT7_9CYAN|nr:MAG: hypothetical protein KA717_35910 [Woronichinia naegeliana WA131]